MRNVLMKLCGVFEAKLLVYYQHRKFVSRAYENTGHFASREGISWDAGHMGRNTGCPGTVGNPTFDITPTKSVVTSPPGPADMSSHNVLNLSVFVRLFHCEHILKTN